MKRINREIEALWESTSKEFLNDLMPGFVPTIKKGTILFVGINPSFSKGGFKTILKGTEFEGLDIDDFYKYPTSGSFDLADSLKIEKHSIDRHPYFKKFGIISKKIGIPWSHLDLFFIRETNQKNVLKMVFSKGIELNLFGESQLRISKKSIIQARPKAIVVANALACKLFCKAFEPEFDNSVGCYSIEVNGERVPVFLTSMLTGQRALDNFSFEHLCWHIDWVLKKS